MRHLAYFLAVAEELNITRAAKKLFISQQALSTQIAKLEQKYMVPLFIRDNCARIVSLSTPGQKLLETARRILDEEAAFIAECDAYNGKLSGTINLGLTHTAALLLVPEIIPLFADSFPKIRLNLTTDLFDSLKDRIMSDQLDMLLGYEDNELFSQMNSSKLFDEQIHIALRKDVLQRCYSAPAVHKLITFQSEVDISDFKGISYLYPEVGTYTYRCIEKIAAKNKLYHKILASSSGEILLQMANSGVGATFCMRLVLAGNMDLLNPIKPDGLCAFPVKGNDAHAEVILYYNKKASRNEAAIALGYNIIKKYCDLNTVAGKMLKTNATEIILG